MAEWTVDLGGYSEKVMAKVSLIFRRTGLDILSRIIFRTPVLHGLLRNNWFASIGSMSNSTTESTDKSGASAISRGNSVIGGWNPLDEKPLYIENNLPYAERIEMGYSKVKSPQGMVRVTAMEFGMIVEGANRDGGNI